MRKYKLDIELFFDVQSDANNVMEGCKSLLQGISAEREIELVKAFEKQVNDSVANINKIVDDALVERPKITEALHSSNDIIAQIRKYREDGGKALESLASQSSQLLDAVKSRKDTIASLVQISEENTETILKKLGELDEAISNARQCAEASLFLRDMLRATNNIVTGGRVTMEEQGRHGFEVVKTWEV